MDVDHETRTRECRKSLRVLDSHSLDFALDAIRMCERVGLPERIGRPGEPRVAWSVAKEHGSKLIGLCRQALRRPEAQKGCFTYFTENEKSSCLSLAMQILALHGTSVDAALLREFAMEPALGRSAIAALKVMEERG